MASGDFVLNPVEEDNNLNEFIQIYVKVDKDTSNNCSIQQEVSSYFKPNKEIKQRISNDTMNKGNHVTDQQDVNYFMDYMANTFSQPTMNMFPKTNYIVPHHQGLAFPPLINDFSAVSTQNPSNVGTPDLRAASPIPFISNDMSAIGEAAKRVHLQQSYSSSFGNIAKSDMYEESHIKNSEFHTQPEKHNANTNQILKKYRKKKKNTKERKCSESPDYEQICLDISPAQKGPSIAYIVDSNANSPQSEAAHESQNSHGTYICSYPGCQKAFSKLYSLKSHELCHQTDKPHVCNDCHASFRRRHDLLRHLRTLHDKTRPYQCPRCKLAFKRAALFWRHMIEEKQTHGYNVESMAEESMENDKSFQNTTSFNPPQNKKESEHSMAINRLESSYSFNSSVQHKTNGLN